MSLRKSAQNNPSEPRRSPIRDFNKSSLISDSRRIKFPPDDPLEQEERQRSDYFSRTKDILSTSKLSYKSPQNKLDPADSGLRFESSGLKSPNLYRTSFTTTNRNRVKFDLGDDALYGRDKPQLNVDRDPVYVSDRLSPNKLNVFPATGRNSTLRQEKQHFEELAYRIKSLESRMEADTQGVAYTEPAQTLSNSKLKSSQNGFYTKNESLAIQDAQLSETQNRRSRLRFFSPEKSTSTLERANLQDSRSGDDTKFSKTYIDHLKTKHDQRVEDLEFKYKEKCKEFEEYRAEAAAKLEEARESLLKSNDRNLEDTRKVQRDFEFQASKKAQEVDFELKSLKNKNKDLEEQLATANRKIDNLQRELKQTETGHKDLQNEQKSVISQLEVEVATLKEQNAKKVQQLTDKYDNERKRLKESYEKLVEELSTENKQTYRKLNDDILKRDKRIKELEREKDELHRNLSSKYESSSHEAQILQETNKTQKKNLEESREDVLRLTSQLDDKKREIYILETQVELLKTEKSRYESEWLKGDRFRKSGLNFSSKKGYGLTSPEK